MRDATLLELLHEVVDAVRAALDGTPDWGPSGDREGQYRSDLAADRAALRVLGRASGELGVLSEESGVHRADAPVVVVVDPLDGSTNAARGVPWYATSLCAVDRDGPRVAVVANQATGERFEAVRGGGARRNGSPLAPSGCERLAGAVVGLSGMPASPLGWWQYRALGAAALDLCAVAAGVLDGYVDCVDDGHGPWDYMGALLVCREAGAHVDDALGRDLVVIDQVARRTPVAAATPGLLRQLLDARRASPGTGAARP